MLNRFRVAAVVAVLSVSTAAANAQGAQGPQPMLASAAVQVDAGSRRVAYDGVVEAVRQSAVAAQVAGAIQALDVKVGDRVKTGQVIARIDARAAEQNAAAGAAQLRSAQAMLEAADKDYQRQRQLYQKNYISLGALERAESQYKAAKAQSAALLAQAQAADTQSGLHVVRAPYAGIVAEVPVALGDMALPGKPLAVIYEPGALRVTASVPQGAAPHTLRGIQVELPGLGEAQRWITPTQAQQLPFVDAGTHTAELRIGLPGGIDGVSPGMFARLWLPGQAQPGTRLSVPASAVLRRGEMTGVYVIDAKGAPLLRQVRLGRRDGDRVEVLAGVSADERVALDPQAAARRP